MLSLTQIKLFCWNANGLPTRSEEFASFLYLHDIDVALISKMHFVSYTEHLEIQNYVTHVTSHPNGKAPGGSAVLVKNNLPHHDVGAFVRIALKHISGCSPPT